MPDVTTARPRWGNEARARKADAIWRTLRRHAPEAWLASADWIDVGCGSGGIAAALAPRAAGVVGIDPEPWPEWNDAARAHSNLRFVAAAFDAAAPPPEARHARVALCNQVYEHVGDPVRLCANLHAALQPGGIAYFAGPNLLWPIEPHVHWPFVHWLPRAAAQRAMRALGSRRAHELDAWSMSAWRLQRILRHVGFEIRPAVASRLAAELELRGWPRLAAWLDRVPVALERWLLPFAPGFVFLLRKGTAS